MYLLPPLQESDLFKAAIFKTLEQFDLMTPGANAQQAFLVKLLPIEQQLVYVLTVQLNKLMLFQ